MSFQFPANPKDGDVVVQPQEGGGFIKGTYNEASNTWEVGELPEEPGVPGPQGARGPQGEKGDPGKGMNISGIVDTYDDLESPGLHPLQFWIVDDVNKVYYSDGNAWFDQGGPVVGPQGEGLTSVTANDTPQEYTVTFEGTQPELNLTTPNLRGATGAPGKGWNSTTIIDERPDNYQIRFNSDDGLEFTTDSIMGPPGDLEVATETNCGCIKIGRGLNKEPDGSVNSGETYVDLETVPLGTDGRPDLPTPSSFTLSTTFSYGLLAGTSGTATSGNWENGTTGIISSTTVNVPSNTNTALVYYFSASSMSKYDTGVQNGDRLYAAAGYTRDFLEVVAPASFEDGLGLGFQHGHNIATRQNIDNQVSAQQTTKIGKINYPVGTTSITFNRNINASQWKAARWGNDAARVVLIPMLDKNGQADEEQTFAQLFLQAFGTEPGEDPLIPESKFQPIPPMTDEELLQLSADDLRSEIADMMEIVDKLTSQQYTSGDVYDQLRSLRQQLIDLRDLPGTIDEVEAAFITIQDAINVWNDYTFRFEPTP